MRALLTTVPDAVSCQESARVHRTGGLESDIVQPLLVRIWASRGWPYMLILLLPASMTNVCLAALLVQFLKSWF